MAVIYIILINPEKTNFSLSSSELLLSCLLALQPDFSPLTRDLLVFQTYRSFSYGSQSNGF